MPNPKTDSIFNNPRKRIWLRFRIFLDKYLYNPFQKVNDIEKSELNNYDQKQQSQTKIRETKQKIAAIREQRAERMDARRTQENTDITKKLSNINEAIKTLQTNMDRPDKKEANAQLRDIELLITQASASINSMDDKGAQTEAQKQLDAARTMLKTINKDINSSKIKDAVKGAASSVVSFFGLGKTTAKVAVSSEPLKSEGDLGSPNTGTKPPNNSDNGTKGATPNQNQNQKEVKKPEEGKTPGFF